jgi:hypothetical protein
LRSDWLLKQDGVKRTEKKTHKKAEQDRYQDPLSRNVHRSLRNPSEEAVVCKRSDLT